MIALLPVVMSHPEMIQGLPEVPAPPVTPLGPVKAESPSISIGPWPTLVSGPSGSIGISSKGTFTGIADAKRQAIKHTTNINNNMNSVMKVLTIIATIFIPITFIAGVYGMNFAFMPELAIRWAYPVVLGVMGGVVLGMIIYFKKKRWF